MTADYWPNGQHRYIDRVYVNNSPLKISGTVAISVVRESCTFSRHPYIGRIARLSLRQHGFLVLQRVIIACCAERCTSCIENPFVCPSIRLSVTRWHCVKTIMPNLTSVVLPVPEIIGGTQKIGETLDTPTVPFLENI